MKQSLFLLLLVFVLFTAVGCSRLRLRMQDTLSSTSLDSVEDETVKEKEEAASETSEEMKSVIDEAGMKSVISDNLQPVKELMKNQKESLTENVKEMSKKMNQEVKKMSKNISSNVDKMARHVSNKMNDVREAVDSSLQANIELALIVLQSRLEELQTEEQLLIKSIQILELELPNISSPCEKHIKCGDCTSDPACGWCNMEQRCVEGDNIGPEKIFCSFYNYSYCSQPQCMSYTECHSCLSNPSCGWCNDKRRFLEGCILADNHACPMEGWHQQENPDLNICPVQQRLDLEDLSQQSADQKEEKEKENKKGTQEGDDITPSERQSIFDKKQEQLQESQLRLGEVQLEIMHIQDKFEEVREKYDAKQTKEKVKNEKEAAAAEVHAQADVSLPKNDENQPLKHKSESTDAEKQTVQSEEDNQQSGIKTTTQVPIRENVTDKLVTSAASSSAASEVRKAKIPSEEDTQTVDVSKLKPDSTIAEAFG